MANDTSNYPEFVFITYDEDFSAQTHDVAVSLESGSLVGVPVKYVRHDLNTRPAAPVDGLETKAWSFECAQYFTESRGYYDYRPVLTKLKPEEYARPAAKLRCIEELVPRSQAEAIIAGLEAKIRARDWWNSQLISHTEKLEADNAALTARVKELERRNKEVELEHTGVRNSYFEEKRKVVALETQLAAARKALEWYANPEIYKPHPHGIGFEDRDKSYVALAALEASHDPH